VGELASRRVMLRRVGQRLGRVVGMLLLLHVGIEYLSEQWCEVIDFIACQPAQLNGRGVVFGECERLGQSQTSCLTPDSRSSVRRYPVRYSLD
jgi:hypothetical protein